MFHYISLGIQDNITASKVTQIIIERSKTPRQFTPSTTLGEEKKRKFQNNIWSRLYCKLYRIPLSSTACTNGKRLVFKHPRCAFSRFRFRFASFLLMFENEPR